MGRVKRTACSRLRPGRRSARFRRAFGAPATGCLGDGERLKLAVAAGMAAAKRADGAAVRAQAVAATPMMVVVNLPEGGSLKGEFGGNLVHAIQQPEGGSKKHYNGQWRNQDDTYNPDGVGVSTQDDREWAGEYSDGYMTGYGLFRRRGIPIYVGEWQKITSNDRSWHNRVGYGVFLLPNPASGVWVWDTGSEKIRLLRPIPYP